MADNLESYFKKHLTKDTPAKESWNVPSDDVWEKVLPEISKKKGLFIPWKYLYILAAIMLAGLAFFFWPTEKADTSSLIEKEIVTDKSNLQSPPNKSNSTDEIAYNIEANRLDSENLTDVSVNNLGNTNRNLHKSTQKSETTTQSNNTTPYHSEHIQKIKEPTQTILLDESVSQKKELIQIASIPTITIDFSAPQIETSLINKDIISYPMPADLEKKKPEPFNNKAKFGIGAFFKPTFTSTYLSGELNNGIMETGNMYLYVNNWGFEAKYYLSNKFTIVAGVEKSEIKSWSKSVVDFGYDTSTEHLMGNGEKENTSPVPMPTPFGEISTEITYRFSASENIPDGEMMNSVLETHQEVRYLSIPIGLEYSMIQFSYFNWFSEGGIAYNRALKDGTSFTSRILHNGHDMDVVGETMTSHPSYTLNYLNFYLGTGLNYQFSKTFQINGSARYFGSITKVNLQDNLSTYVHGFNFKIGIIYIF